MEYPVTETLVGIFAFGLVIIGIVFNGISRAKEFARTAEAAHRMSTRTVKELPESRAAAQTIVATADSD